MAPNTKLLDEVSAYYSRKITEHGDTPRGVDWNSEAGQVHRFEQLCRILPNEGAFLIHDIGCGYGALYDFLAARRDDFFYRGIDVSQAMLDAAAGRLAHAPNVELLANVTDGCIADYSVASGIFNVRLDQSDADWREYIVRTLEQMAATSRKGFAFNCLTSYSDADHMRPDLYYADPCWLFDLCKRRFSRNVALLHDYDLYEFTMLVRT
ncbi:class I SAM-dependent methyltransferase [Pandoraea pnomenusa]|uniref:class I SAM-dependent methyltransferase n=1 Tax=Pandoraea pnomenusa TaxID=93220 RepID=UPI001198B9CB|nr:class I SAM-dependent methyltransferase [Pandoraea pnomenusa]QDX22374.1 class I SAM-dependent methyltransferase [Pandoraea pnomenusa]